MWQWFNDNGSGLAAVAAIITGLVAIWAIVNAKQDSRDRSRPVVIVELGIHPDADLTITLTVRNAGPSVARNLTVSFDQPLAELAADGNHLRYIVKMFGEPISVLGPGQALSNPWRSSHRQEGMPDSCNVTVAYVDSHDRPYTDEFKIDAAPLRGRLILVESDSIKGCIRRVAKEAEHQTAALRSIASSVARRPGPDADYNGF
jgi:hypothetical protein